MATVTFAPCYNWPPSSYIPITYLSLLHGMLMKISIPMDIQLANCCGSLLAFLSLVFAILASIHVKYIFLIEKTSTTYHPATALFARCRSYRTAWGSAVAPPAPAAPAVGAPWRHHTAGDRRVDWPAARRGSAARPLNTARSDINKHTDSPSGPLAAMRPEFVYFALEVQFQQHLYSNKPEEPQLSNQDVCTSRASEAGGGSQWKR